MTNLTEIMARCMGKTLSLHNNAQDDWADLSDAERVEVCDVMGKFLSALEAAGYVVIGREEIPLALEALISHDMPDSLQVHIKTDADFVRGFISTSLTKKGGE